MKWTPQNANRNIFLYYLYCFLSNLDFARGIFVLYLVSKGISASQVGILQTLLFWSNLAAEIPAGIWADRAKRKYSVALGLVCIGVAALIMIYSRGFWLFSIAFLLHGIGFAFQSGADNALLFDGLKQVGSPWSESYVKFLGRSRGLGNIGMAIAMCVGGLLFAARSEALYLAFAVAMGLGAIVVLLLNESHRHTHTADAPEVCLSVFQNLKAFFKMKRGRSIFWFILGMGFLEASHAPLFIYGQMLFKDYHLPEALIALVMAASMSLNSVGFLFVERLAKYSVSSLIMVLSLGTSILTFAYLAHPPVAFAVAIFILVDLLPGLLFVHTDNYINDRVPSEVRASILSVHSFLSSIFISFAFLGAGQMMEHMRSHWVLGSLGVLPLLGMLALSFYFNVFSAEVEVKPCGP